MKKVVGYAVSIAGIAVMALGFGIIAIIVGVVISLTAEKGKGRKKVKDGEEEIPIYEGVGKKRKVVGYRKD